jgi:hypothetical protein
MTIMPKTRMTVLLEKPEKAWAKVHTPLTAKIKQAIMQVKVEGIHSVRKFTIQKAMIANAII